MGYNDTSIYIDVIYINVIYINVIEQSIFISSKKVRIFYLYYYILLKRILLLS